jgi:hypothetical protein
MQSKTTSNKLFAAVIGFTALFAVVVQLSHNIAINKEGLSIAEQLLRFFTFFTILTNLLVGVCCTCVAAGVSNFFSKPKVLNGAAIYITIVGLIYNVVLRSQFVLTGIDIFLNELLHVVVPLLFILYWLFFVPKNKLKWTDAFPLLWYPLIYLAVVLLRGANSGHYPYPFVDVKTIGYSNALLNSFFVTLAFLFISFLFIGIAKLLSKNNNE